MAATGKVRLPIERSKTASKIDASLLTRLVHELRNPLAPIRMAVQIMQMSEGDVATTRAARVIIDRQLQQLTRLVDSLSDISQLEHGRLQLHRESARLGAIITMALAVAQPELESRQNTLDLHLTNESLDLYVDAARLSQAVANVLINASKFSPLKARVRISTATTADDVVIVIEDSGIGIPAELLSKIFEPFGQLEQSGAGGHDGLGIGLALAKSVFECHGGSIDARSAGRERGSVFVLTLPRVEAPPQAPHPSRDISETEADKLRILIADDNHDAAHTLAIMLGFEGHDVRTAHDGFEALAIGELFRPDLVFLDIGMPVLDGYQTARQIRERDWGRDVYLVALTGWGLEADRRAALQSGFQDHVVKPAVTERLVAVIEAARRSNVCARP